jgi:hypothetical protein
MSRALRQNVAAPKDAYAHVIATVTLRSNARRRRQSHPARAKAQEVKKDARPASPANPAPVPAPPAAPAPAAPAADEWDGMYDINLYHPAGGPLHFDSIFDDPSFDYGRYHVDHPPLLPEPPPPAAPPPIVPAGDAELVAFAEKARPKSFWSESEFLYMHGHLNEAAEAARVPGEDPARAAGQHRPLGSVMFINKLPEALKTCPCRCSTRNPSSDMSISEQLRQFVRSGYLVDGEMLQMMLPGSDAFVDRWRAVPRPLGRFRILADGTYAFYDESTGDLHCCPTSWAFCSYMLLCANPIMPTIPIASELMQSQLMLKSHAFRFIYVQQMGVSLYQLSTSYRHDLGMFINARQSESGRARVPLRDPPPGATHKTREQVRLLFAEVNKVAFPEDNAWMAAQNVRINELMVINEGYRKRLEHLSGSAATQSAPSHNGVVN